MVCPVDGCRYDKGRPAEGTVVGMKRHVRLVHGLVAAEQVIWPPIYLHGTSKFGDRLREEYVPPSEMTFKELRELSRKRGLSIHGKNRAALVEQLS